MRACRARRAPARCSQARRDSAVRRLPSHTPLSRPPRSAPQHCAEATARLPAMPDLAAQQRRGRLFVGLAAIAWSTAGLLQRELTIDVPTQLAGRAFFAGLGVGGYIVVSQRGRVLQAFRAIGWAGLAIAALLAISSGIVLRRAQLRLGCERALHAGACADHRCGARHDDRRPRRASHVARHGDRTRGGSR